ncbi:hypothetical protein [Candidatus Poriferisocius sp.]|uniref:hypothetical protein n=1 Tax=Candidatus Poriferisocius sp. TaxID=3101276 RepID=UPI003B5C9477
MGLRSMLAIVAVTSMSAFGACGGSDQPDLDAFCGRLETAFGPEGALASDYSDDPSAAQAVVNELESVREVAPLEIEPSLAVINDTMGLIIAAFGNPAGGTDSGAESGAERVNAEKLQEAGIAAAELARYSGDHCGLVLDWESTQVPLVPADADRITGEVRLDVEG